MPPQAPEPILNTTQVVSSIVASVLSAGVSAHWYKNAWGSTLKYKLSMRSITKQLKQYEKMCGKENEIAVLEWTKVTLKLYSPSAQEQILAIGQLYQIQDERVYDILVQRLVSPPPIGKEAVGHLLGALRKLSLPGHTPSAVGTTV